MLLTELSKPRLNKLANYLVNEHGDLSFNSFVALHEDLGLGTKRGSILFLTEQERLQLKLLFEKQIGDLIGFLTLDSQTDRIVTQSLVKNEKSNNHIVTINDIRMYNMSGIIRINNKSYSLPYDGNLTVQYDPELVVNHQYIVICENLTAFIQLYKYKHLIPTSLNDALFIYRGNGTQLSGVYKLCVNTVAKVGVMSDLDLAGIVIAKTIPNSSFALYPEISDLIPLEDIEQPQLWNKQLNLYNCAQKHSNSIGFNEHFSYLKKKCVGVTQEAIFARNIPLQKLLFNIEN